MLDVLGIDWDTTAEHHLDALSIIAGKFKTIVVITCKQQISVLEPARMLHVDESKIHLERYSAGEPLDYTRWVVRVCHNQKIDILLSADNEVCKAGREAGVAVLPVSGLSVAPEEVLLSKVKLVLESKGFKTSWANPLWEWMHNKELPSPQQKNNLFVAELPIPRITPFDCAYCRIGHGENQISFEIYLCFVKEPEKTADKAAYDKLIDMYTTKWVPEMDLYFGDFALRFGLTICTEFDASFDYCLWKNLAIEQWNKISHMMLALKSLAQEKRAIS